MMIAIQCKSIVLGKQSVLVLVIAFMHYKFFPQVKSALQISFFMLRRFVMQFILTSTRTMLLYLIIATAQQLVVH